jgi:hypothetical protein
MKRSRISHLECKKSWNLRKLYTNLHKSVPIKLAICDNYIRTSINLVQSNWRYATTIYEPPQIWSNQTGDMRQLYTNLHKSGPINLAICDNYIRTSINLVQSNWRYATTIRTSINLVQSNWRYATTTYESPYGNTKHE